MPSFNNNSILRICIFLIFVPVLIGCQKKAESTEEINPEFTSYISAFTAGSISNESSIRIRLTAEYQEAFTPYEPITGKLFRFQPSLQGVTYWVDSRTIEFKPDERMKSGAGYNVSFDLSKVTDVPDHLKNFEFHFQILQQTFSVEMEGIRTYSTTNLEWLRSYGRIITADVIEDNLIEKVLQANQNRRPLPVTWEHDPDGKIHEFIIDSLQRTEKEETVELSWDGHKINIDVSGSEKINIPALGDFKIMEISVVQQPEQYILLRFSDPLDPDQYLRGLITLENGTDIQYIIEDNVIKAYPSARQTGILKVNIEAGIKNILGYKLKTRQEYNLSFQEVKPAIRLLGKGVILPHSNDLIFPFEAVNLKAVEVKVIRIYENNIGQFLQVNYLDGNSQLKRVGRLILKKTINLTSDRPIDWGTWNTFSLDLADLIHHEPGAIYRIELGFRKNHSLYPCQEEFTAEEVTVDLEEDYDEAFEEELSYWDSYESYYYDDYEDGYYYWDYSWEERDDPCSNSYYGSHRSVSRNILASDLGIIAKGGADQSMTFAVTDLRTTEVIPNVTIEVYNYQQQLLGEVQTNTEGLAEITLQGKPFYLVVRNGEQRGYLRLDDGSSLSLSTFDVTGNVIQKGIKGYIYGERGVWRPGDTLFLSFMLEDKNATLPQNHPVSFELINPNGQVTRKIIRTSGTNGLYSFITATDPEAPTGNWTIRIKVGGTTFTKWLRIETVKPNRLKINLDFGVDKLSVSHPGIKGTIEANWLHGAVARNLRAQINTTLSQIQTSFPKYADFNFDDPVRSFYSEEQTIFDGYLNEEGMAVFSTDIYVSTAAPGMLRANFVTRVFEESGEFSIDRFSIPYSPFTSYVGIKTPRGDRARGMLLTDTTHTVYLITLDPDGNPISRDNLDVKIYKINWRWWWDASYDNLASYIGSREHAPIFNERLNTRNGEGSFRFKIDYPEWGRFLIRITDPVSGHTTGKVVYIDWPGWAGRAQREHPGAASMLTFSTDKQTYSVGESAILSLPTSGQGRALVSIENGSRVLEAYWIEAREPESKFTFKISQEMTPNIYIHVTFVQPHAQTTNDLPVRLYGVIPVLVENPETRLTPVISMPDVLKPEGEITIGISEKNNQECAYTLAIVDEGLLDLTRFRTPDPWSSFYAREALGVKTWDVYDMVLGAYGGKIEKIFSIGGGWEEEDGEGAQSKANRFPPMVKFLGPFVLKKGQTNNHSILLPRYVGSVKTMVVAGNQKAYGSAEKITPVRKPLMVLATLPRVLGPSEQVKLPVTIFAMEENLKNVEVEITANDFFDIIGRNKETVSFSQIGDKVITFNLKVKPQIGIGKVNITAKSGLEIARYDIELDIRNPNPPVTEFIDTIVEPGQTWEQSFRLAGMPGTNTALFEVSNIPPIDFGRRLKYLISYPHGCIEQTTSAVFPQLFLDNVMDLDEKTQKVTEGNIKAAILRINSFMLPSGGLGYWPNAQAENEWGTSYAGHFMIEAELKGYGLPVNFIKNWLKYQKKAAKSWRKSTYKYRQDDLIQAYRLYTLALANSPDLGSMNRLREQPDLSTQARWRLAAAYMLAGQPEVAQSIINTSSKDISYYSGFNYSYGSRERDWAMILETLTLMDKRSECIDLVKKISDALAGNNWLSTQTTAYCLLAMSKFAGTESTSKELKFEYVLEKGRQTTNVSTRLPFTQFELDVKDKSEAFLKVTNKGTGIIFARITMEGVPEIGNLSAEQNNLVMSIEYTDMKGNPMDMSSILQGTDFLANVTVINPRGAENYRDMALIQIFPSGWEIHNTRMDDVIPAYQSSLVNYQDIRDDRVYTYFHLPMNDRKKFVIQLNAAYLGKFFLPTVYCEAMYDNRINARIPGKWVEVIQ
ncbi:MAG: hypothetical protein AMS27_06450 [Bacteroides sp. SM23_62_1]|nr:MAG: hypothetical protein AMS27_06450 [Bacteroides sp. SM23_62_1]